MPESFGARLRQRREESGIDLIAIAEQTKIKLTLLDALERDDVSLWPSGIFRRAYIRTYAQFIGLDPDLVVREFLELYPDPVDMFSSLAAADLPDDGSRRNGAPPTRLRTLVDSALDSLARLRRQAAGEYQAAVGAAAHVQGSAATSATLPAPASSAANQTAVSEPAHDSLEEFARPLRTEPAQAAVTVGPPPPQPEPLDRVEEPVEAADVQSPVPVPAAEGPVGQNLGPVEDEAGSLDAVKETIAKNLQSLHEATLETLAGLCTDFGRVVDRSEVQQLLEDAARALNAAGLIVWLWDEPIQELRAALASGYSDKVLAHLPTVSPDARNATAAAFRSSSARELAATPQASAALVVPLLVPEGCEGVLAIELEPGMAPTRSIRAMATVLAAAVTQLVLRSRSAHPQPAATTAFPAAALASATPVSPVKVRR
jgi:cytoskeletal protein RodZ